MNYSPWWGPQQFGAPPQPQIIYVPMPPQQPQMGPMPMPQPMTQKGGGGKISAKKLKKFHAAYEELISGKKPEEKKDDKKKTLKEKTFTWFEMTLLLITWSIPMACLTLGGFKMAIILLRSLVQP